jgi:hypothetical protein
MGIFLNTEAVAESLFAWPIVIVEKLLLSRGLPEIKPEV